METIYTDPSTIPLNGAASGLLLTILGGFLLFILVIALFIYIYIAICLVKIARKTSTDNAWFAWIPILNIVLMVQCAQKPLWWIILFFIPFANVVAMIIIWMAISKNLGKPEWLGILMIIPIANLIIPGYLAFSKSELTIPPSHSAAPANPVQ